jgi:hypothetical protein
MARSSKSAAATSPDTAELLNRLTNAVAQLAGEVGVLRTILDEIQDDIAWAIDNGRLATRHRDRVPPMHITSMAKDPLSRDWAKLLDRTQPKDLPPEALNAPAGPENSQQSLF